MLLNLRAEAKTPAKPILDPAQFRGKQTTPGVTVQSWWDFPDTQLRHSGLEPESRRAGTHPSYGAQGFLETSFRRYGKDSWQGNPTSFVLLLAGGSG